MSIRRPQEAGFSLIEGLVSMLLMLIVVLGILPLFPHSMAQNLVGRQSTQASNLAHDRLDSMLQLPLDNDLLTIPAGDFGLAWVQLIAGRRAENASGDSVPENSVLGTYTTGLAQTTSPEPEVLLEQALAAGPLTAGDLSNAAWIRVGIVRQFRITSLSDGIIATVDSRLDPGEQLPGGTDPGQVHLKQIDIVLLPRGDNKHFTQTELRASLVKAY